MSGGSDSIKIVPVPPSLDILQQCWFIFELIQIPSQWHKRSSLKLSVENQMPCFSHANVIPG